MDLQSASALVYWLDQSDLLEPSRRGFLKDKLQGKFRDAVSLGKELIRLGWLTPYQLEQIQHGNGELLSLGPYRIMDWIGEGGVSQVFKAWHMPFGCVVALKVIRPSLQDDAEAMRQFQLEMKASAQVSHPNVVRAVDADPVNQPHWYSLEFVDGTDLGKIVEKGGPLILNQACSYIKQAAAGLQHAYERGVVHRDIKPANLLLTKDGTVKIADMGLARLEWLNPGQQPNSLAMKGLLGTPDFIAPEQATKPDEVDIRADIYSLGCTLYFLLSGHPPFPGKSLAQKLMFHQTAQPIPIEHLVTELPGHFPPVLQKMMAKSPNDRYRTPAAVVAALAPFIRIDLVSRSNKTTHHSMRLPPRPPPAK